MGAAVAEPLDAAAWVGILRQQTLVVADVSAESVCGGAERMLVHHIRALVHAGHKVALLTRQPRPDAPLRVELDDLGITEYRLPFSGDKGFQGLKQLQREAKRWWKLHGQGFEQVVAEQPFVMWALLKAGCALPRLQVIHSFAFEEYRTRHALNTTLKQRLVIRMMQKLEREVYGSANNILILSRFMQQRLELFFAIGHSEVVPGAAEQQAQATETAREQSRQELGWQVPVITTLRNLVPRTGVDLMIQTAAILKSKGVAARWVIMGDGPLLDSMRQMGKELAVDDIVEFTGFLSEGEVQKRLRAAEIFMVPTRGLEGFGLVTLEANASGLRVLATPIAANAELVPMIAHNRLAADASPAALAQALMEMLKHPLSPAQREELREQSLKLYNWGKHDQEFLILVEGLR